MKLKIATQISFVFSALILVTAALVGYFVFVKSSDSFSASSLQRLQHSARVVDIQLASVINAMKDDVEFLIRSPALRGIVRARSEQISQNGDLSIDTWKMHFSEVMETMLRSRSNYMQVRLIGLADGGKEIIRLNRADDGTIYQTPEENLQRKGDREYFRSTVSLRPQEYFISDINLNREFGSVSLPHLPTLRISAPVENGHGGIFGIVIINVHAGKVLQSLRDLVGPQNQLFIANHHGDYLLHPDSGKTFGFDRGADFRIQDDFPATFMLFNAWDTTHSVGAYSGAHTDRIKFFTRSQSISDPRRFLIIGVSMPITAMLANVDAIRERGIMLTLAIALAGIALAILFARFLTRPLEQMARAVSDVGPAGIEVALPTGRRDEIGALARTIESMSNRIAEQFAQLEIEIDERKQTESQLREAQRESEAAMRVKEEFLSVMSHEIRTPLNAVIGMTRLLFNRNVSESLRPYVDTLKHSADHLLSLINDILDYSKINSGIMEFQQVEFDVRDLARNTLESHRPGAEDKKIAFALHIAPSVPEKISGDPVRFNQVLNNLIDNALKFTEKGSVCVHLSSEADSNVGMALIIEVVDTGIGIAEDEQQQIFERFTQASSHTARKHGGSGLGLTICKQLVELQGGAITVKSAPGVGSRFVVTLPISSVAQSPANSIPGATMTTKRGSLEGLRALYVEDVEYNRFLMQSLCAEWRVDLELAPDGETGASIASRIGYNIILMDLLMPGIDGFETARRIRTEPGSPNRSTPIIAVTAHAATNFDEELQNAGFDGYLVKPIDESEVFRVLQQYGKSEPNPMGNSGNTMFAAVESQYDNNPYRVRRALALLLSIVEESKRESIDAIRSNDPARLRRAEHKARPHLETLKQSKLLGLLAQVLHTAPAGGLINEDLPISEIEAEFDMVLQHIKAYRSSVESSG